METLWLLIGGIVIFLVGSFFGYAAGVDEARDEANKRKLGFYEQDANKDMVFVWKGEGVPE